MTVTDKATAGPLADVVFEVPYSSVSQYYEYYGDAPAPAVYGLSCVWQTFEVGRRLEAAGHGPVRYLVDGRHVAAVTTTADGMDVYDPYLLHLEPLRLRRADAGPNGTVTAVREAVPFRSTGAGEPAPGRVRAVWTPKRNRLRLEYTRFSPSRGHHVVSRMFTFATDRVLGAVPPPAEVVRPLLLHPEQNNLSVRVVDRDLGLHELVYPLAASAGPPHRRDLLTRDNEGRWARHGRRDFDTSLGAIADTLAVSTSELVDFVLGGVDIYRRIVPADLEIAPYSLEDE
ncbi:hypothetical protein EV385_6465 [Krasilnikovia cinnamomea]|uniref:Uncharacterized protein n=1 Tax=Krasilnikovia cinnamomea TaxID=349313 RepID=A0A4Q7ZU65_9ACTN|nr:hypothetical protein [Krasilnikovia cinnamomea]RZU54514.1 hypothetical protein EV385_6465 [Krasilnikovia cinnamomea]